MTLAGMGSNLILQWLQKYVIAEPGETRGLRIALYGNGTITKLLGCQPMWESPA